MAVPKFYEFHIPMLQYLGDGQPHKIKDVKEKMKDYFHLTEEDLAGMLPSGRVTTFANRVGWASTYLKAAGLIDKPACAHEKGLKSKRWTRTCSTNTTNKRSAGISALFACVKFYA